MASEDLALLAAALLNPSQTSEVQQVTSALRRFKCLQSCSEPTLTQVAEGAQLKTCLPGETICRYGENEQALYLVLAGTLAVSMPGEGGISCQVGKLTPGMSFGGVENQPNGSTFTACEDVSLGVVEKPYYDAVLKSISAHQFEEKVNFLRSVPLFSKLSKQGVSKLAHFFTSSSYTRGDYLYKEGDQPTGVHLIVSGEIELVKHHSILQKEGINLENLIGPRDATREPLPVRRLLSRRNKTKREESRLCVKGSREMVGDLEVIAGAERGCSAFVRSQHAEVMFISKSDFLRRLQNPEIWGKIQDLNEVKQGWMQGRIDGLEEANKVEISRAQSTPRAVTSRSVKQARSPIFSPKYAPVDDSEPTSYLFFPTEIGLPSKSTRTVEFTNAILREISSSKQGSKVLLPRNRFRSPQRHSPPPNFHAFPSSDVNSTYRNLKAQYSPKNRLGSYDAEQLRKRKEMKYSQAKAKKSLSPSKHNLFRVIRSREGVGNKGL